MFECWSSGLTISFYLSAHIQQLPLTAVVNLTEVLYGTFSGLCKVLMVTRLLSMRIFLIMQVELLSWSLVIIFKYWMSGKMISSLLTIVQERNPEVNIRCNDRGLKAKNKGDGHKIGRWKGIELLYNKYNPIFFTGINPLVL